jgi:hypothetical protein
MGILTLIAMEVRDPLVLTKRVMTSLAILLGYPLAIHLLTITRIPTPHRLILQPLRLMEKMGLRMEKLSQVLSLLV